MTTRLRWKKKPRETGMKSAFSGPRGSKLHDGTKEYARVQTLGSRVTSPRWLWFWVAFDKNTCNEPCEEEAEAKAQAMAFVKKKLAEASEQSK